MVTAIKPAAKASTTTKERNARTRETFGEGMGRAAAAGLSDALKNDTLKDKKTTPRATRKATAPAHEQRVADEGTTLLAAYTEAQEKLLAYLKAPSWKRVLCAFATTLAVGAGVAWLAGIGIELLAFGMFALTGSAYVDLVIRFFGIVFTLLGAGKVGSMAWDAVLEGKADEAWHTASSFVAMKFVAAKRFVLGFGAQHA